MAVTTTTAIILAAGAAAAGAYASYESGQAQKEAAEAQAQQAESDARTQTIERKRKLIETLAQQNVGAAAQGRTISSLSSLQQEDVRRAGYDETLIAGGAAAEASASRAAGKSAAKLGTINAGASLLKGGYTAGSIK